MSSDISNIAVTDGTKLIEKKILQSQSKYNYLQNISTSTKIVANSGTKTWAYSNLNWNKLMHILTGNRRSGYNIGVWNCRKGLVEHDKSPSSKLTDIQALLQNHDLHLLGVVESDLHSSISRVKRTNPITSKEIIENLHVEGYTIKLPKSWECHGQARIILYVRDGVHVKMRDVYNQDSDLPSISCEIGLGREKKTCANFYYREWMGGVSGLGDTDSQKERLSRHIRHWKSLYSGGKDVVIMGDTNLCSLKWDDEAYNHKDLAGMLHDFFLETSSYQQVKQYTRSEVCRNGVSRSCIDHCTTNVPEKLSKPLIESAGDSDHLAVIVTKFTKAPVTKPQTVRKRTYKNFCVEMFLTDILNSGINDLVTAIEDIEEAAEAFQRHFSKILDFHAPMKTFQMRNHYLPQISEETKLLIAERNALQEEASRSGNLLLLKEHKIKAKEVKNAVKVDKKEHFEKNLGDEVSVSKAWKTARDILGTNKSLSPTIINQGGSMTSNPSKMANIFNDYFLEKVRKLREKTASAPVIDPAQRLKAWIDQKGALPEFKLKEINLTTLRKILKRMKGKRSHVVDLIDSFSLKLAGPLIEDALLHLINLSIRKSRFAAKWKPQLIFPLHKKAEKHDPKNFRPVSHLVEIGKMVEYAAYFQVIDHFTTNKLFHENHHGSLSCHSTATALIQLMDMWLEAAENTELSAVLLLDQSAAYDLVDHQILLQKLEVYNFHVDSIEWFRSYLSHRSQMVQVESKQSKSCNTEGHAVPQGSILGGLIFLIFSNDFPACTQGGESVMYVDDDTEVVHDKDAGLLKQKIQLEADLSTNWLKDNRMCVAGDKSKLLVIGTRHLKDKKLDQPIEIQVDNKIVMETRSEKLLGVIINNELTWKEHLYGETWRVGGQNSVGLIPQLSQRVGILKKLSKYVSKERLKLFSNGIFYSKLNYCLPVFGNVFGLDKYRVIKTKSVSFTREDNRRLQVLQNSVMKLLTGTPRRTATTTLLQMTNTLYVQQLVAYHTLTMVNKVITTSKPAYLASRLKIREEDAGVPGWNQQKISAISQRLSLTRCGFIYRGSQLFNSLPTQLRKETDPKKFSQAVRTWVVENIPAKPT